MDCANEACGEAGQYEYLTNASPPAAVVARDFVGSSVGADFSSGEITTEVDYSRHSEYRVPDAIGNIGETIGDRGLYVIAPLAETAWKTGNEA